MMNQQNYIYAPVPEIAEFFRCKVPMKGTHQIFLVDGGVQGTGKPLNVSFDRNNGDDILQVIGIRTAKHLEKKEFSTSYTFEEGVCGKLILCSHTFTQSNLETEETIHINLERGAVANIVVMQNEHNGSMHTTRIKTRIAGDASLRMTIVTLHGGNITNNVDVNLAEPHADCEINGIYLVDGSQVVTNCVNMLHSVPDCTSRQLFKGIIDNRGVSNFSGLIKVVPDAQKTEAYQENHNLILTNEARSFSEPQLEIYADDVKCTHGATNGRLDENELFYMRSRGIPVKEARLLQQLAFAHAVIDKISTEELKGRMMSMVEQRLRGEFLDCNNCCTSCC